MFGVLQAREQACEQGTERLKVGGIIGIGVGAGVGVGAG
jgi:hypothetical protein